VAKVAFPFGKSSFQTIVVKVRIFHNNVKQLAGEKKDGFTEVGYKLISSGVGTEVAIKVDDVVGWKILKVRQFSAEL